MTDVCEKHTSQTWNFVYAYSEDGHFFNNMQWWLYITFIAVLGIGIALVVVVHGGASRHICMARHRDMALNYKVRSRIARLKIKSAPSSFCCNEACESADAIGSISECIKGKNCICHLTCQPRAFRVMTNKSRRTHYSSAYCCYYGNWFPPRLRVY